MLQPTADQNAAVPRFIGIGEIHLLFRQERAQMFVDLLERRIFEGFNGASLLSVVDVGQNGPVLDDLDAGELFEDPALRRIERELGLFRFEAFVYRRQSIELFDTGARVERYPFNQSQDRRRGVHCRCGECLNLPLPLLGLSIEASLFLHLHSPQSVRSLRRPHHSFWCIRSCRFTSSAGRMPRASGFCGSRPRLFCEEASDIGNDLIAMTPLRQQNRVSRSAEKQARITGRITWLSGVSMTYSSRVWSHASFSDKIASRVCLELRGPEGRPLTSPPSRDSTVSLPDGQVVRRLFIKTAN